MTPMSIHVTTHQGKPLLEKTAHTMTSPRATVASHVTEQQQTTSSNLLNSKQSSLVLVVVLTLLVSTVAITAIVVCKLRARKLHHARSSQPFIRCTSVLEFELPAGGDSFQPFVERCTSEKHALQGNDGSIGGADDMMSNTVDCASVTYST